MNAPSEQWHGRSVKGWISPHAKKRLHEKFRKKEPREFLFCLLWPLQNQNKTETVCLVELELTVYSRNQHYFQTQGACL